MTNDAKSKLVPVAYPILTDAELHVALRALRALAWIPDNMDPKVLASAIEKIDSYFKAQGFDL